MKRCPYVLSSQSASTELSNLTSRVKKEPEVKNAIEYSIKAIRMYVKDHWHWYLDACQGGVPTLSFIFPFANDA